MKICIFFIAAFAALFSTGWTAKPKIVCYYGSWASYREGNGRFTSENINPYLCTHVIYQYTGVDSHGGIAILDKHLALPDSNGLDDFRKFVEVKRHNPELKMMMGIGGFNEGSAKFSRMAAYAPSRDYFVRSVVIFMNTYKFDGLSVDWMYPGGQGGSADDKRNFVLLLQELKQAFSPDWVLSIVGSGSEQVFERGYDVQGIMQYVDFVSLLSFDYHGSWEVNTGLNAPVFPRRSETDKRGNQDFSVNMWLKKGMDASKLLLGIPTYGRTWTLQDISQKGISAKSSGPGQKGVHTKLEGTLGYNELVEKFRYEASWTTEWEHDAIVPYAHRGDFWISYDDRTSVGLKAEYILKLGLGGAMIMQMDTDDSYGLSTSGETHPLINAVKKVFDSGSPGKWTLPPTEKVTWAPPTRDPNPWTPGPTRDPNPWTSGPTRDPNPWTPGPTREPVTSRPPPGENDCYREGQLMKDPTNCSRYYVCVPKPGGFLKQILHCPETLVFDETSQGCNYKALVPGC